MLAAGSSAMAQNLNSAYFTDQFASRNTMNPAFGNDQNFVSIPGLGNVNISLQGNFGYEDVVMKNPRFGIDSNKKMTTFMNPYISDAKALDGFSTGNNRVVGDVSVALLAAGFKAFGGYNTVELNSKYGHTNSSSLRATPATTTTTSVTSAPTHSRMWNWRSVIHAISTRS